MELQPDFLWKMLPQKRAAICFHAIASAPMWEQADPFQVVSLGVR